MKKLLLTILIALLLPSTALGQKAKVKQARAKATEPVRIHWQASSFCPDATRCDKAALWYEPGHGTILLTWKGSSFSASVMSGGYEHVVTREGNKETEVFRKEAGEVCADCGRLKNGDPIVTYRYKAVAPAEGKALAREEWVKAALHAMDQSWQDNNTRALAGGTQ